MKKLEEFAENQSWLEAVRFSAFRFITDGVSGNEKVLVTHHHLTDSRYTTEPQMVIVESDKRFKPYKGMTRANLVELPEGMNLYKLSNYSLPKPFDKATSDQIASVMLQHGTPSQREEVLRYMSTPSASDLTIDPRHWNIDIPSHPVFDPSTKTLYGIHENDWLDAFIELERASDEYSAEELVIVNKVLTRLEAKKPL